MTRATRLQGAAINQMVTGQKFKDPDAWLYASLSQPPLKVLDKNGTDDEMEWMVECQNCHRRIKYGTQAFMNSGHIYCDGKNCRERLIKKLEKKK